MNNHINTLARRNLKILADNLEKQIPGTFDCTNPVVEQHEKNAVTNIPLYKKTKIDDMVDMLEKFLSIFTLYAIEKDNHKYSEAIIYSLPKNEQMYVIRLYSNQYRLLDKIEVTFYTSFDIMFYSLRNKLQNIPDGWEINEKMDVGKFFRQFS